MRGPHLGADSLHEQRGVVHIAGILRRGLATLLHAFVDHYARRQAFSHETFRESSTFKLLLGDRVFSGGRHPDSGVLLEIILAHGEDLA